MSRDDSEAVALFVREHPDCKVSDVVAHFRCDAAMAWVLLIDAQEDGFITGRQEHGTHGTWHFRVKDAS